MPTLLDARRRSARGSKSYNAQPNRPIGELTLPAETAGPALPAAIQPPEDAATGAAPPRLPASRDPSSGLAVPDALARDVFILPILGGAGRIQRALDALNRLTSFTIPELPAFDAKPKPARSTFKTPATTSPARIRVPKSQTVVGKIEPTL